VLSNLLKIDAAARRMPPALAEHWKRQRIRNILVKKNQARRIREIVEFFAQRGTRVMLVKGAALDAAVYDEPWYTESADVDLLVDTRYSDLSKPDRLALNAILARGRFELEFMRHHDVDMNEVLDIDYRRLWAEARTLDVKGLATAYVTSPEDMLLLTCINLCRKRYVQLKGMVAVRELTRTFPGMDWAGLARNALACGASRIVYAALAITAQALGCAVPASALAGLRVGCTRRWAIHGLSRSVSAYLAQVPELPRGRATRLLASGLLRIASYRLPQFWREVQVHKTMRRYWKERAEEAARATGSLQLLGPGKAADTTCGRT